MHVKIKSSHKDPINAAVKFLEVYCVLNSTKYNQRMLTVLAYYCVYGISDETDVRIREEYFRHQNLKNGRQSIYNARMDLKKMKLLMFDDYHMVTYLNPQLKEIFADFSKGGPLGYVILFETEV